MSLWCCASTTCASSTSHVRIHRCRAKRVVVLRCRLRRRPDRPRSRARALLLLGPRTAAVDPGQIPWCRRRLRPRASERRRGFRTRSCRPRGLHRPRSALRYRRSRSSGPPLLLQVFQRTGPGCRCCCRGLQCQCRARSGRGLATASTSTDASRAAVRLRRSLGTSPVAIGSIGYPDVGRRLRRGRGLHATDAALVHEFRGPAVFIAPICTILLAWRPLRAICEAHTAWDDTPTGHACRPGAPRRSRARASAGVATSRRRCPCLQHFAGTPA